MPVDPARPDATRAVYDAVAEEYDRLLPGSDAETVLDLAVVDDFAARCLAASPGPVLDVGCGTGRITAHLRGRGLDVTGVDLSPGMVAVARRRHPDLLFAVGTMTALDAPDGHLAGAVAWYSVIHTPPEELGEVVAELRRVLRPGGWSLVAFQAGHGERVEHPGAYGGVGTLTGYRHDPGAVAGLLEGAGLGVRIRLVREAEGRETTPQALLLARSAL